MKNVLFLVCLAAVSFGFDWGWNSSANSGKPQTTTESKSDTYYNDSGVGAVEKPSSTYGYSEPVAKKAAYNTASEPEPQDDSPVARGYSQNSAYKTASVTPPVPSEKSAAATSTVMKAFSDENPEKAKERAESMRRLAEALRRMSEERQKNQ
ncbi:MAG: hypothetical protein A2Z83_02815 [Omnitrophica bacterium GWA2_52_8]|nr:MAG: hypothetical protein A2Z83_02815 [Omnitrophica bacterium GWA2_52_8]